jgi:nicotinamidase-related amidase
MKYDRITPDNAAVLLVDHQTGLVNGIQDQSAPEFNAALNGLVQTAAAYDLPTVITSSAADGPNGPILPLITNRLPNAPLISRPGEINAFDNADFKSAVEKTGRKKLIIAGVSTDVCVTFAALSAVELGYDVHAVIDASGTWNKLVQETAVARMIQAGVTPTNWVAVAAELQADWRKPTGEALGQIMGENLPFYGNLIGSFLAAKA